MDPELPITQFVHSSWQTEDGLPQNTVNDITQDTRGYIWLATQAGLVRFDGVDFKVYTKSTTPALRNNQIKVLHKTRADTIWIGTMGGGVIRMHNGRFFDGPADAKLHNSSILSLFEDRNGTVWIGTLDRGLYAAYGRSLRQLTVEDGLSSNSILSIADGDRGELWIGTDAGLNRRDAQGGIIASEYDRLRDVPVPAVKRTQQGVLWIGTSGQGIYRQTVNGLDRFTTTDGLPSNSVSRLYEDRNGALWIGLRAGGVARYYNDTFSTFTPEDGLTHSYAGAFYQDHEGTLWIGTDRGGLNQLRDAKFTTITTTEGLSHNVVLTVMEGREGSLWAGTDGGGLNRIEDGTISHVTTEDQLSSNYIYSLAQSSDGALWIGTYGGGLCRLQNRVTGCYTTGDGLTSDNIFAIESDAQNGLWLGTEKGLMYFRNGDITIYDASDGLAHNWVNAIHQDDEGILWIGTVEGGISRFQDGRFTTYDAADGLESSNILTLHEDHTGTLWAGTQGGGLCRMHEQRFQCISGEEGLHSDDVLQITEDEYGNLWIGGMNGIERVSLAQLTAVANDVRATLSSEIYRTGDGLGSSETNGGIQPASWRTQDGRLLFATMKGLAMINPSRLVRNRVPPPAILEEMAVEDRNITLDNTDTTLTVPPGSRSFEFRYTGLSFIGSEQVTFKYKLDGYDESWIEAGSRRQAFYTNLAPGPYRFQVIAINNDGVATEQPANLSFFIKPHFYQTWWFYALCAGGLFIAAVGGYQLRVRQLQAHQEVLNRLVEEQTRALRERERELKTLNEELEDEVQRQLDVILTERSRYERELIVAKRKAEESERLKSNILMNMSHEIRTPLATISGFAEELKDNVSDRDEKFVEFIQRSSQRLLGTLNSVLEMSQLEAGSMNLSPQPIDVAGELEETIEFFRPQASTKNLELRFKSPPPPVEARLDKKSLHRIMNNLIGNALKFTEDGYIAIELTAHDDDIEIRVEDTGSGIDPAFLPRIFEAFRQESSGPERQHEGTGLGLAITKHLIELMDGDIGVKSKPGDGTCFTIRLPRSLSTSNQT
jgi:ligand-binding sensor domain-containing protein/signal transduction histidine kinase